MTNEESRKQLEDKALSGFMKSLHWRRVYENAPEGAKEYYRLMFGISTGALASGGDVEGTVKKFSFAEERDRIYTTMDEKSWQYIMRNAGHAEAQGLYIVKHFMQGKIGARYGYWFKKTEAI